MSPSRHNVPIFTSGVGSLDPWANLLATATSGVPLSAQVLIGYSGATSGVVVTGAVSPSASSVVLLSSVADDKPVSVSGCGLTWAEVADTTYGGLFPFVLWAGTGTASSGGITVTYPDAQSVVQLVVDEVVGVAGVSESVSAAGADGTAAAELTGVTAGNPTYAAYVADPDPDFTALLTGSSAWSESGASTFLTDPIGGVSDWALILVELSAL